MPNVACPGCGRRIMLTVDDLSKTIVCFRCETHFNPVTGKTVEAPVRAGDGPEPEPEPSYDPIYEPPSRPMGTGTVLALFGMVAVVVLVVIVVALIKSGNNAPVAKKEPPAGRRVE